MNWLKDPLTRQPSVALTLLVIASIFMVAGIVLEAFTTLRSSHLLDEFFGAAIALFGGHLVTFRDSIQRGPNEPPCSGETLPNQDIRP
jgi:hypothetical protein